MAGEQLRLHWVRILQGHSPTMTELHKSPLHVVRARRNALSIQRVTPTLLEPRSQFAKPFGVQLRRATPRPCDIVPASMKGPFEWSNWDKIREAAALGKVKPVSPHELVAA
jgi:hypothetical protein